MVRYTKEERDAINKEANLIVKHVLFTLRKGKMPLIKVLGHPGTGKSGLCIRLAELLNFKLHGELSFDPMYVVDNIEGLLEVVIHTKPEDKRVIVVEELSTLLNNRRFMGKDNVAANNLFDTMRKKGMIVISNYPIDKTVDSHIEKLFNVGIEVLNLDKNNHQYFIRAKILQTNPGTGKTYNHLFKDERGFDVRFFRLNWGNKDTFEAYDEGKDAFMNQLYQKMLMVKKAEKEKEYKKLNYDMRHNDLTEKQENVMKLFAAGHNVDEIAAMKGVSIVAIHASKRAAFKKGFNFDDFKPKNDELKI